MNILLTGGNFKNKGAQSMLFTCISELKALYPECTIYFGTREKNLQLDNYKCTRLYFSFTTKYLAIANMGSVLFYALYAAFKDIRRILKGRPSKDIDFGNYFDLRRKIKDIDMIIDISGFSFSDKWSKIDNISYINNIRLAKKYNIPMYLFPQSFGPFDFKEAKAELDSKIKHYFAYPKIVFARETDAYNSFKNDYNLENVELSTDLVLQNKSIDINSIYLEPPKLNVPIIKTNNNVAIVPNKRCFDFGRTDEILSTYKKIITVLLENNKEIYIFRHSIEDLDACLLIKKLFSDNEHVHIIENDFSCFEYNEFIKNFEFLIVSRYHGIVHAYKNLIPCVLLGWAIKYQELAQNVNQSEFVFDITNTNISEKAIIEAVNTMMFNIDTNKEKIRDAVVEIQKKNCFQSLKK